MTDRAAAKTVGRVPDGALSLPVLEAAYRIAELPQPLEERSALLTVALREFVSERDAKTKIKWTLNRVWNNPPDEAAPMIKWAIEHPDQFPDRRAMHIGALMATFPFVGSIVAILGRAFSLNEPVTVIELRRRAVALWGASSTVEEGAGKSVTTLRRLGVVEGGGRSPIVPSAPIPVSALGATWLIHAVMLARQVEAMDVDEASQAPDLFWVAECKPDAAYPMLEVFQEGVARRVWAIR